MVSEELNESIKSASMLPNVKHSDHCPVVVIADF
jgi:exonuclease III